jgi:3-hydroxyacyl-[acyl-carrier-protein] dehydratase
MMTREQILAAIPHRPPFLLVDEVLERTERRIVGRKTFVGGEDFFAAMQCGAILLAPHLSGEEAKVPVVTRMGDVRFKRMVRPGEVLRLEVELVERLAEAFFLKARVTIEDRVVVRFEFACMAAEKNQ